MDGPQPDTPRAVPAGADLQSQVTQLLLSSRAGDAGALDRLFPLVYEQLHEVAHLHLRRDREDHTLSTTALVHEAYLKLVGPAPLEWQDRKHFLALASRAMRQVLIDHARRYHSAKRGGGLRRVDLDATEIAVAERADTLIALDEALKRLAGLNPRLSQVVEYRFFGGLTEEETAQVMGVADRTVRRDWVKARGWLDQELSRTLEAP